MAQTTSQMADEQHLWEGHPSQLVNLGLYILCVLIVPIPFALWRWLVTKTTKYELTTQRIFLTTGILSKLTDALELYRVRDIRVVQPFWLRMFGLGNVVLETSDRTSPDFVFRAVEKPRELADAIRGNVEICRKTKGVREVDFES